MKLMRKLLGIQPMFDEDDDVARSREKLAEAVEKNRTAAKDVDSKLVDLLSKMSHATHSIKQHGD